MSIDLASLVLGVAGVLVVEHVLVPVVWREQDDVRELARRRRKDRSP